MQQAYLFHSVLLRNEGGLSTSLSEAAVPAPVLH